MLRFARDDISRRYAEPPFSWIMGTSGKNRVALDGRAGLGVWRGNPLGVEEQ